MNYNYKCPKCKCEWENSHIIADRNKENCPRCGGQAKIDIGKASPQVSCYDHYSEGLMVDDHSQDPADAVTFHSKKDHKEWLKRRDLQCPAFL